MLEHLHTEYLRWLAAALRAEKHGDGATMRASYANAAEYLRLFGDEMEAQS